MQVDPYCKYLIAIHAGGPVFTRIQKYLIAIHAGGTVLIQKYLIAIHAGGPVLLIAIHAGGTVLAGGPVLDPYSGGPVFPYSRISKEYVHLHGIAINFSFGSRLVCL